MRVRCVNMAVSWPEPLPIQELKIYIGYTTESAYFALVLVINYAVIVSRISQKHHPDWLYNK